MLGNEQDAKFIRDWQLQKDCREFLDGPPNGWTRLGSGCYRVAYLHTLSGVVYKVERDYSSGLQSNTEEYENLRSMMLTRLPKGVRFPRYSLYRLDGRSVAAMEHFPKLLNSFDQWSDLGREYWKLRRALCDTFPDLWDMHGANIAVDEEAREIVPIDLGGMLG